MRFSQHLQPILNQSADRYEEYNNSVTKNDAARGSLILQGGGANARRLNGGD